MQVTNNVEIGQETVANNNETIMNIQEDNSGSGAEEIFVRAEKDIKESRDLVHHLIEENFIKKPSTEMLDNALKRAINQI